jgi:mono/diheme cytochrome c family protein
MSACRTARDFLSLVLAPGPGAAVANPGRTRTGLARLAAASGRRGAALLPALVVLLLSLPGNAQADTERGRLLYENHCTGCHQSTLHIRSERKVGTEAGLRAFIQRWAGELKLTWKDDELNDVYQYLNSRYYRFGSGN